MTADVCSLTISELAARLARREASPVEAAEAFITRIAALDPDLNAYITVDEAGALAQARQAEDRLARGETGALLGVPLAIKDVMATRGLRTTCGSKILENFVPPYDATVCRPVAPGRRGVSWARPTWTSSPWAPPPRTRPTGSPTTPGTGTASRGARGGSAAAVAAGEGTASLGSDTGGSIRQPAVPLRCRGAQAHLRAGLPLRSRGLRLLPGPDRPPHQGRRGRGHPARSHRRPRPRIPPPSEAGAGLPGEPGKSD